MPEYALREAFLTAPGRYNPVHYTAVVGGRRAITQIGLSALYVKEHAQKSERRTAGVVLAAFGAAVAAGFGTPVECAQYSIRLLRSEAARPASLG
ncbi:hypothetical protein GCM10023067_56220 [Aminobacter aganoensis]